MTEVVAEIGVPDDVSVLADPDEVDAVTVVTLVEAAALSELVTLAK